MKKITTFFMLTLVVTCCVSQQMKKSEITLAIQKNVNRVQFSKLSFFPKELIELGTDTSFQSTFARKLRQYGEIKRRTVGDQQEYDLTLNLLYKNLAAEKVLGIEHQNSKDYYLTLLKEYKEIHFTVDENLVLQQINDKERGLTSGYDEGATNESTFFFLCYDPVLFKRALLKRKLLERWKRTGIFLCNYLRENENPLLIRSPIKEKIVNRLKAKEIENEFKDIIKDIIDCNVTVNLFD